MHDVVIVGAGAVGLYLSGLLKGMNVVVLDKNKEIGKKADSGLYSANLRKFVPLDKKWTEHKIVSANLHSPEGEIIELKKQSTAAYVVDRERFTRWLAGRSGGEIRLNVSVNSVDIKDRVVIKTNRGVLESRMLIGCDGANSAVRRHFGVQPEEIINGIIGITKERNRNTFVDLFFDKKRINDGFFWKIPRGETTEYGALGKNVNYRHLEGYFGIRDYEKRAAFMNVGLIKTFFHRALLVGEAACQVKPWSCGGVIYGFTCAGIARDVIMEAFECGDFSENFLKKYDDMWKERLGKAIKLGMMFRKKLKESDNARLESYFRWGKRLGFLNKLDMDFPQAGVFG